MKLYCDPLSTTTRPVLLFAAEHGLALDLQHVDLMSRQQLRAEYLAVNPTGVVPYLVDGDFGLGESSAILKYLADLIGSDAYPSDLKERARVNAAMDWFATNLQKDFTVNVCYAKLGFFSGMDPHLVQALIAAGEVKALRWLKVLDQHMIGDRAYVCGESLTLADYLGSAFVTMGELAGFDFKPYPNIRRWLSNMKALPGWNSAYAAFNGWLTASRDRLPATA